LGARTRHEIEIEGRTLALTNLDKPLYPSGYTKGQAIDFYIRVSDYLLPHLAGRPVTLKRYPNGVTAPHFYEKNAPRYTPDWIERFAVARRGGGPDIQYIVIRDLPTLVWCANTASLELHPFLSRAPDIERPTAMVFDLDPGEGADLRNCAQVALRLREVLQAMDIESFPKVSGSKGMQVYAPLNTPVTYAETQPLAKRIAEALERENPSAVISTMAKAARKGKVFIDWSQNSDFKTTVCVYSLRAKSDEPFVSLPVTWDELTRASKSGRTATLYFKPDAIWTRLKKTGDLFAPVLQTKQTLPAAARSA